MADQTVSTETLKLTEDGKVFTADLHFGVEVKLSNGWKAIVWQKSARGTTPMCKVFGFETEIGSVYAHDIVYAIDPVSQKRVYVKLTPAQEKCKKMVSSFGW